MHAWVGACVCVCLAGLHFVVRVLLTLAYSRIHPTGASSFSLSSSSHSALPNPSPEQHYSSPLMEESQNDPVDPQKRLQHLYPLHPSFHTVINTDRLPVILLEGGGCSQQKTKMQSLRRLFAKNSCDCLTFAVMLISAGSYLSEQTMPGISYRCKTLLSDRQGFPTMTDFFFFFIRYFSLHFKCSLFK